MPAGPRSSRAPGERPFRQPDRRSCRRTSPARGSACRPGNRPGKNRPSGRMSAKRWLSGRSAQASGRNAGLRGSDQIFRGSLPGSRLAARLERWVPKGLQIPSLRRAVDSQWNLQELQVAASRLKLASKIAADVVAWRGRRCGALESGPATIDQIVGGAYKLRAKRLSRRAGKQLVLPASDSGTVIACWQLGQRSRIGSASPDRANFARAGQLVLLEMVREPVLQRLQE